MQRICAKDHGSAKCPSVVPFEMLHSEGPFEVASFEHFGLDDPSIWRPWLFFTPKCPSEGDISRLECTISFFSFSGQITTTCSSFVRACLRPRGFWGSSEFASRHTSPLLQTELCACFSCRDNSCVLAVANWVSAWTVDGYCSRLRLSKRYCGSFVFRVILNTSLCVKRDAVGGECLTVFCLCFCTARVVREVGCIFILFSLRLVRAPS